MTLNPVIDRLAQDSATLRANWTLPPEDAKFLYLLARLGGVKRALEVGTSIGFSTLHLALAVAAQNGHVSTIDADAGRQEQAKHNLAEAGLAERVIFHHGDALTVLEQLIQQGQTFDLMFLDARKSEYIEYFNLAEKLLPPGGILLADNTRSHRDELKDFLEAVSQSSAWESCDMETPNGFVLARRR